MACLVHTSRRRKFHIFLNISFILLVVIYLTNPSPSSHLHHYSKRITNSSHPLKDDSTNDGCMGLNKHQEYKAKCDYVKSASQCKSDGYIEYLEIFYCTFGRHVFLGYTLLVLWLVLLFYLLADTTAYYFCSSLGRLSKVLNLSPTVAGVTLLSLGNGAPDVFSSIVSFAGAGSGDVGLNSVLGGAFFVSSVVVGIISISVSSRNISVEKSSYIRDTCFFLVALLCLVVILIIGRINIWIALSFTGLYVIYVIVSTTQICGNKEREVISIVGIDPFLPSGENDHCLDVPLLVEIGEDHQEPISETKEAIDADNKTSTTYQATDHFIKVHPYASLIMNWLRFVLELPLYLPRRLTIPVVSEEKWSKPFAVISVTLAPVLLVVMWNSSKEALGFKSRVVVFIIGVSIGSILGVVAYLTTENSSPPKKLLILWLAGGFVMSVTWTYVIAEELVALLITFGNIIGISPSILGLTVLAWGNSIGDLIANFAMSINGGLDGAQVAISGCYAGPLFNTLVGLGLSLVFSSWHSYPSSYEVPRDPTLFQTLGFLVGGLLWALVILPRNCMRLDRVLGAGLLAIYLCFLSLRLAQTLGLVQLHMV